MSRCARGGLMKPGESDVFGGVRLSEHTGLIWLVVNRYRRAVGGALQLVDLAQAGWFGLLRAAETFDPERGVRFSSYAVLCIRRKVRRELDDRRHAVRVPVYVQDRARKRGDAERFGELSLDEPAFGDSGLTRLDLLADDDAGTERGATRHEIEALLERLDERTRAIIRARFWSDETLEEVGARHGLSKERIRQIERDALIELRRHITR